jgi:hypothetical protein
MGRLEEVVYLIEAVGLDVCKIGYSKNLGHRLAAIQTCCPAEIRVLALRHGDSLGEFMVQTCFSDLHVYGEWFTLDERLLRRCAMYRTDICRDLWESFLSLRETDAQLRRFKVSDLSKWEIDITTAPFTEGL